MDRFSIADTVLAKPSGEVPPRAPRGGVTTIKSRGLELLTVLRTLEDEYRIGFI